MKVRLYEDRDIPQIVLLCHRMRAESMVPYPPMDEAVYRKKLKALGGAYLLVVAETGGEVVGFMGGIVAGWLFTDRHFVAHEIFYVRPESRGTKAALMLITALETWAVEQGAERVTIGVHTGVNIAATHRFYHKLGYAFMGGNYYKVL